MNALALLLLSLALGVPKTAPPAKTLRVAAAADLRFAMNELAAQYERSTGVRVAVTYGSSGNFFAQIENGAPFDLFFSADSEYPRQLVERGSAAPGSLREYAAGRLVLWAPEKSELQLAAQGWAALSDSRVTKIAIANPALAPYGRSAVAAMQAAGVYPRVRDRLVFGESVLQAAQFVQSGNAQAAVLPLSLALSPEMKSGQRWEIPAALYPAILQSAVILRSAADASAARNFLNFVTGKPGQAILASFGFGPPAAAARSHS